MNTLTRREFVKGIAGVVGLAAAPSIFAACAPSAPASLQPTTVPTGAPSEGPTAAPSLTVAYGQFHEALPKMIAAFHEQTGIVVSASDVDQGLISDDAAYLGGSPADVFTFFAGYRMRRLAAAGFLEPLDDVWASVGSDYGAGVKSGVTGEDGHQYLLPIRMAPWAVFYRKGVFARHGYDIPKTFRDMLVLADRMRRDGLIPMAMGDDDHSVAMATFDAIDLRENGADFHLGLLAGREKWTDRRVAHVFDTWRTLLPFTQKGGATRTFHDAAAALVGGEAGMHVASNYAELGDPADNPDLLDVDMFRFPDLGTKFDAERALDAPMDGFAIASHAPDGVADRNAATAFLEFLARGSTQVLQEPWDHFSIPPAEDAEASALTAIQQAGRSLVDEAQRTSQFLDRDTDYVFASHVGDAIADFLTRPDRDIGTLMGGVQHVWDTR